MSAMIRKDLSQVLLIWIAVASLIWLGTPWGTWLTARLGPAWLWCALIPLTLLLTVRPRLASAALANSLRVVGLLRLVFQGKLADLLDRPVAFRPARVVTRAPLRGQRPQL